LTPPAFGGVNFRFATLPQQLYISQGSVLEGFNSAAAWTVINGNTPTDDTTNFREGSQSIKLDTTGAGTNKIDRTITALDLSSSEWFDFWTYSYNAVLTEGITIFFNSSTTGWTKYFQTTLNPAAFIGWQMHRLSRSNFQAQGGMTWDTPIVKIRIQIYNTVPRNPIISFDDFRYNVTAYPACCFTFDDGRPSNHSIVLPHLNKHNMVATVYVVGNQIGGGGLTASQLQDLVDAGWAVSNHSQTHAQFTALTQAEIEAELNNCVAAMDAAGVTGHVADLHAAYPYGSYDDETEAALAAVSMATGRTITAGLTFIPGAIWYRLPCYSLQATVSLATAKSWADYALTRRGIVIFYTHNIVEGTPTGYDWGRSDFEALVDYCTNIGLYSLTIDEIYKLNNSSLSVRIPEA